MMLNKEWIAGASNKSQVAETEKKKREGSKAKSSI